MESKDIDAVYSLLQQYLEKFDMAPRFTREEIEHWMLHKKDSGDQVVWAYVVEVGLSLLLTFALLTSEGFFNFKNHRLLLILFHRIYSHQIRQTLQHQSRLSLLLRINRRARNAQIILQRLFLISSS